MTDPVAERSDQAHDNLDRLAKIAAKQKIITEGLESGISELSMADIRRLARQKVGLE